MICADHRRPIDSNLSAVITYRVEIDGAVVGPPFEDEEEEAHRWVAHHHPGTAFTIVETQVDQPAVRVRYPPIVI